MIAIGGNSLIRDGQRGSIAQQFENARATGAQVAALAEGRRRDISAYGGWRAYHEARGKG